MSLIPFFDLLLKQESLTPILLVLNLRSDEELETALTPLLDEVYRLSWERHVFFPFSRAQLAKIEDILDPIVARRGCPPYGISYLLNQSPWRVLEEALNRWESCALITDRGDEDLPFAAVHLREANLPAARATQWYHVQGSSDTNSRFLGRLGSASTGRAIGTLFHKPQAQPSLLSASSTP
jgi:hypothetical protein